MKSFLFFLLCAPLCYGAAAQCTTPTITASGSTTFCPGGSVTLSAPAGNVWKQKADFGGGGRLYATGFAIGSKGYIGTGNGGSGDQKDFWEYDPATDVWTQKADFGGTARNGATGFAIGNKGYIGTGVSRSGLQNDFWEYDLATNVWTQKVNFGGAGRFGATGFAIGSKGYIGTGAGSSDLQKDFWEYDPATNRWTQKADFGGGGRDYATGFAIDSKGYIGTGSGYSGFQKDFWEYDLATNVWKQKADVGGTARAGATGFSIGSKGYIGTGAGSSGLQNDFCEYDPATNVWKQKADFGGGGRIYATGFSIGSKGYIGTGGGRSGDQKDFWEYDPGYTYSWSPGGQTTASLTVATTGNYSVTTTNALGCSATSAPTAVTVNAAPPTPLITASGSTTFCEGGSVTLSAPAGFAAYRWSSGDTTQSITVSQAGSYTLTVTNNTGCTSPQSTPTPVVVKVLPPKPVITAAGPLTFCPGGSVILAAPQGFASYAWSNGATTQAITVAGSGSYSVTVGNEAGCTSAASDPLTVSVEDKQAPVAPALPTLTAECSVTVAPLNGTDNCAGTVVPSTSDPLRYSTQGTYTVHWTYSDGNGNSTVKEQTVVIKDTTPPTVTASAAVVVAADPGKCTASNLALGTPVYGDNCTAATLTNNAPAVFPGGKTTVTWTVTDGAGNKATATQSVTVQDNQKPVIIYPATLAFCYAAGGSYTLAPLQATDNCGIDSITYTITGVTTRSGNGANASGPFNPGTSIINWKVKDASGNTATGQTSVVVSTALTVSIPDTKALSSGVNANTVYLGYTPAGTLTLSAQVSGGSGNYGYQWSTGALTPSVNVSPTSATPYTVTVRDAKGCSGTANKVVEVVDVSCGGSKVNVCHKGKNTLCIDKTSVPDHLGHGDYLGACQATTATTKTAAPVLDMTIEEASAFALTASPNPSTAFFTLRITGRQTEKVTLSVTDALGRVVETRRVIAGERVEVGERYGAGLYMATAVQGGRRVAVKLVKQ